MKKSVGICQVVQQCRKVVTTIQKYKSTNVEDNKTIQSTSLQEYLWIKDSILIVSTVGECSWTRQTKCWHYTITIHLTSHYSYVYCCRQNQQCSSGGMQCKEQLKESMGHQSILINQSNSKQNRQCIWVVISNKCLLQIHNKY